MRACPRLDFPSVLASALVIGVFSMFQMSRLNNSTQDIYEREYTARLATEQQSASLEKTKSYVQQMASITKRYADSASQAAELSHCASRAAVQGGQMVANVVEAMEKIRLSTLATQANIGSI